MNRYAKFSISTYVAVGAATTLLSIILYRYLIRERSAPTLTSFITDPAVRAVWKDGTKMVANPWHFRTTTGNIEEERQQVTLLLKQVFAVPPEQQEALARRIASENTEKSHLLWYEALLTGHEMVAAAIIEGGKVMLRGADVGQNMERSVQAYLDTVKENIWEANEDEQRLMLQKFGEEHPIEKPQLLFDAAVQGQARVIEMLIDAGTVIHPQEIPSLVPLHAACFNGNLECARVLHSLGGVAIDYVDEFGASPLMRAATAGHIEIAQWLLEHGADINLRDSSEQKMNALVFAVWHGHKDLVQLLIERGSVCTSSVLDAAAHSGNLEIFEMILNFCNIPGSITPVGQDIQPSLSQRDMLVNALGWCGENTSTAILNKTVDLLLPIRLEGAAEGHNDVGAINEAFIQALTTAAKNDAVEVVDFMFEFMQKHLVGNLDGQSSPSEFRNQINLLLSLCAESGSANVAKYLIEQQDADVDSHRLPHHSTVLYHAAAASHVELIELLVAGHGADIHQGSGKFANGPTALWKAVEHKHEWAVRKLLELGGPVEAVTADVDSSSSYVLVVASKVYRAPVTLTTRPLSSWFEKDSPVRFLCLQYPQGLPFLEKLQFRKPDAELKDERDLRLPD